MTVIAMRNVDMSRDVVPHGMVLHDSLNAVDKYSMPDYSNYPTMRPMEISMLRGRKYGSRKVCVNRAIHAHCGGDGSNNNPK